MTGPVPAGPASGGPRLVVPFYVNPVADPAAWVGLGRLAGRVERAIVNVHNGPGAEVDPTYVTALAAVPAAISLLGYVRTDYGRRAEDDIRRDAALWRDRYQVADVMLDEVSTAPDEHDRLVRLVDRLRGDGATVVAGNPGTVPIIVEMIETLDLTCVYEGTCADYAHWATDHVVPLAYRTWHLVHSCDAGHVRAVADLAGRRGAGSLWVSTDQLPHPWTGLTEELLS